MFGAVFKASNVFSCFDFQVLLLPGTVRLQHDARRGNVPLRQDGIVSLPQQVTWITRSWRRLHLGKSAVGTLLTLTKLAGLDCPHLDYRSHRISH
jgi:hypothetical protein